MSEKEIMSVLEGELAETGIYVLSLEIKPGNDIRLTVDGETRLSVMDCVKVNRIIEAHFDRDVEDYKLQVTSPGADQPLTDKRQYKKNTGRNLLITKSDGTQSEGKLTECMEDRIVVLEMKKYIPEGKKTAKAMEELSEIPFSVIKEAKVIISFK